MYGPRQGDLGDSLGPERQPFVAETEDQDARRLAVQTRRL